MTPDHIEPSASDKPPIDGAHADLQPGLRPELQKIIASGRRQSARRVGSARSALLLIVSSLLLLWLSFTPVEFAPAAWLALVPLIQLIRLKSLPRWTWLLLTACGFIWGVATLQWMRLGDPAMIFAMLALAFYVGLYFPAFIWISRRMVGSGLPVLLTVPVAWTALELARAYLLTGFSWYYLGHSQYQWLSLIQISDLTGAYGVSFVVAMANAALALQVPAAWLKQWNLDTDSSAAADGQCLPVSRLDRPAAAAAISVLLVSLCCLYGTFRLTPSEEFGAGPAFALIQGNFTPEVKHDPDEWVSRYRIHDRLTRSCTDLQPAFIVWPETMWPWPDRAVEGDVTDKELMDQLPPPLLESGGFDSDAISRAWRSDEVRRSLHDHAAMVGAALVMGVESHVVSRTELKAFNSAAFVRPDLGYVGRYDKMHRVIFGEYIPLKDLFPWLSNLTPFGPYFGIAAGDQPQIFEYAGFRIAPLICFEDTVPHVVRQIAGQTTEQGQTCDVLVNLTNDAWFRGSSELDQHLITAAFRCVETRKPLVRAVNGGISAFIDGNGQVREPEQILVIDDNAEEYVPRLTKVEGMRDPETGKWRRQMSAVVFGQVPLDDRSSFYLKWGDLFARACLLLTLLAIFWGALSGPKAVAAASK